MGKLGRGLFDALFHDEIRALFDVSRTIAAQEDAGVRLRLRIEPPELAVLPWEYLFDAREGEYLCLSAKTPVVRYPELPQPIRPLAVEPPLRVLGMTASPEGVKRLDVEQEKKHIQQATQDLRFRGLLELVWLEGETWRDLQRAMRRGPWHIFHFIGHGAFDEGNQEGVLYLTGEDGEVQPLAASQLGRLLADQRSLRLAWLNACRGAGASELDIFTSTAATLVRRGLPGVVAQQFKISDGAAVELSRVFYEALADGYPVEAALSEARIAVSVAMAGSIEWGTAVLYLRAADGSLFEVKGLR